MHRVASISHLSHLCQEVEGGVPRGKVRSQIEAGRRSDEGKGADARGVFMCKVRSYAATKREANNVDRLIDIEGGQEMGELEGERVCLVVVVRLEVV